MGVVAVVDGLRQLVGDHLVGRVDHGGPNIARRGHTVVDGDGDVLDVAVNVGRRGSLRVRGALGAAVGRGSTIAWRERAGEG